MAVGVALVSFQVSLMAYPPQGTPRLTHCEHSGRASSHFFLRLRHVAQPRRDLVAIESLSSPDSQKLPF